MFIVTRTLVIKEGFRDEVIRRFSQKGAIDEAPGFVDLSVLSKCKPAKGEEEILLLIRWESMERWKEWEKSDAHLAGHRKAREQGKPDYMISSSGAGYELMAVKSAAGSDPTTS